MSVPDVERSKSGQDGVFRLAKGYYTARALLAMWRLGLLERAAAGEELRAAAVAAEHGVAEELIRPLFDYLVVRGYLEAGPGGGYLLSAQAKDSAPYFGYLSTMIGAYEPVFSRLERVLTGELVYGRDVSRSHEEMVRGLTALEDQLMGTVADAVAGTGARKVLDMGCGSARMLTRICELDPGVHAVGVDIDHDSLAVAKETVRRRGLDDRVNLVQGDAFDIAELSPDVLAGVDTVTVMFLLHEVLRQRGREGTVRLLADIAGVVGPGGRLVMVEVAGTTEFRHRENQLFTPEYELFHEYTNQRLATAAEWEAMLGEAGMRVAETRPVDMCQAFCMIASPTAA
jgi:ubiquinone/menaquinone biosynthesis C-methylase UbiE